MEKCCTSKVKFSKGRLCSMIYEFIIAGGCEIEAKAKRRVRNE